MHIKQICDKFFSTVVRVETITGLQMRPSVIRFLQVLFLWSPRIDCEFKLTKSSYSNKKQKDCLPEVAVYISIQSQLVYWRAGLESWEQESSHKNVIYTIILLFHEQFLSALLKSANNFTLQFTLFLQSGLLAINLLNKSKIR